MKRLLTFFLAASLMVSLAVAPVSAQDASPTPTPTPATVRGRAAEKREETQAKIQDKRGEVRTKVAAVHGRRLKHRFGVYFARLSNIIDRLQERLTLLKAQGKDTAAAEEKLTDAEAQLAAAKTKAETATNAFLSEEAAQQRETALQARDIANEARGDFMDVFQIIKEVVRMMKAL